MKQFSDIIKGDRIELSELDATRYNAEVYYKFLKENETHLSEFDNLGFDSVEDVLKFLEHVSNSESGKFYGIYKEGTFIGYLGFEMYNSRDRWVSLYFALAKSATGKGFMTEAVKLFADEFFAKGGNRLQLTCCTDNKKSAAIAERCGFKREGVMRKRFFYVTKGQFCDDYLYSLIKDDIDAKTETK
ncbi:MAG: GNAT family N-acetyltransferase [Proteobacteria bacterium]|nr:GNAT family N-acetyltransferase [Pseudomonadota bacterium]